MRHGLVEALLKLAFIYPYRCENCNNRFYRFRPVLKKDAKESKGAKP